MRLVIICATIGACAGVIAGLAVDWAYERLHRE